MVSLQTHAMVLTLVDYWMDAYTSVREWKRCPGSGAHLPLETITFAKMALVVPDLVPISPNGWEEGIDSFATSP